MGKFSLTTISLFLTRKAVFLGVIFISVASIIALTVIGISTDDPAILKATNATTVGLGLLIGFIAVVPYLAEKFLPTKKLSDEEVDNAVSNLAQAKIHVDQREYTKAIQKATAVLNILPKKAEAYRIRAMAYSQQGKLASALADWTSAINLEPGYPYGHSFRASIYKDMGEHQKAIEDFRVSLVLSHDVVGNYFQLAQEHFIVGEFKEAKELFEKVISLRETSSDEKRLAKDFLARMPKIS